MRPGLGWARLPRKMQGILLRLVVVAPMGTAPASNGMAAVGGLASGPRSEHPKRAASEVGQYWQECKYFPPMHPRMVWAGCGGNVCSTARSIRYQTPITGVVFRRGPLWHARGTPTCLSPPRRQNQGEG